VPAGLEKNKSGTALDSSPDGADQSSDYADDLYCIYCVIDLQQ